MKSKNIFLICLSVCFAVLLGISTTNAAYVQQYGWWDDGNPYQASNDTFAFSVHFDLFFDAATSLYRYDYTITNTADSNHAKFQTIQIAYSGTAESSGYTAGGGPTPTYVGLYDDETLGNVLEAGFNTFNEGLTGDTIWMTSYDGPGTNPNTFRGEGVGESYVTGATGIPSAGGVVPEPSAMLLLGFGLIGLLGIGKKKFGK